MYRYGFRASIITQATWHEVWMEVQNVLRHIKDQDKVICCLNITTATSSNYYNFSYLFLSKRHL